MPRKTWESLAADRRERVLDAAMEEFGQQGYSAGSLNVIARESGVAQGSLFHYFHDKFDLFAYVAEQASLTTFYAMQPTLAEQVEGETFLERIGRFVEVWMAYTAANPLQRGVMMATAMEMDPQVRRAVREPVHRLYVRGLGPLLEEGVRTGGLRADADLEALLSLLILLLAHLALAPFEPGLDSLVTLHGTPPRTRAKHTRRLVTTLLEGVLPLT